MDKADSAAVVAALAAHAWAQSRPPSDPPAADTSGPADNAALHALVVAVLGADPALDRLSRENPADAPRPTASPRTARRIVLALEEALDGNDLLAAHLAAVLAGLRPAPAPTLQPHPLNGPTFAGTSPTRQNSGRW